MSLAGDSSASLAGPDWIPLKELIEKFTSFAGSKNKAHVKLSKRCRSLLRGAVTLCAAKELLVSEAVQPFDDRKWGEHGSNARILRLELAWVALRHLTTKACDSFEVSGLIEKVSHHAENTEAIRRIILWAEGPLWKDQRQRILATLRKATGNSVVQENAYAFLCWFDYLLREESGGRDAAEVQKLIRQPVLLNAIWGAATARKFSERCIYRIRQIPELFASQGGCVKLPKWWQSSITTFEKRFGIKQKLEAAG